VTPRSGRVRAKPALAAAVRAVAARAGTPARAAAELKRRRYDELYPLVLGTGKRFFRDGNDKTTLTLERTETAGTGVVMLVCEPAA